MKNQVSKFSVEDHPILNLKNKVKELEEKVFKKVKRLKATEAQRFLIFLHLGLVEKILQIPNLSQKGKALLVSVMMDIDPDNARKYLTESVKNSKPLLDTESNYTFLEGFFEELAYEQKVKEFHKKLLKIRSAKDLKRNSKL